MLSVAVVNLFTKSIATVAGISFTIFLYAVFTLSERLNAKKANTMFEEGYRERVNAETSLDLKDALEDLSQPNRVLVAVKTPEHLYHLEETLRRYRRYCAVFQTGGKFALPAGYALRRGGRA